jgi:ATP-dependent helicase/nuclease subunit B
LPTRRACRARAAAFLRAGDQRATILPRLVPIGDADEDELALAALENAADVLDLPPAIPALRRELMLARLILAQDTHDGVERRSPAQAARLAAELARLLDQVETERLDLAALAVLVPERFAAHWRITIEFLRILTEHWPAILAEEGCVDPAIRRNLALEARVKRWQAAPPRDPVIAAGSTGSIPATADLIAAVASLPDGAVVLPGLDRAMDAATRASLTATHPQHAMMRLLARLGVAPEAVAVWDAPGLTDLAPGRAALVAAAMQPADAPDRDVALEDWNLDDVKRIDCPGPQEEAASVALVLRWAIEEPMRTAALVTPDRALARRVAAELARWDIAIDDSAGVPLSDTPPGVFLRLVARMIADRAAPVSLLAALKHPLARGGDAPATFRSRVRALERAVLRGPRPAPGFEGIDRALADSDDADAPALRAWLRGIADAARPFANLLSRRGAAIGDLLAAHVEFASTLARDSEDADMLWSGEAGEALAIFVGELDDAAVALGRVGGADWPTLFEVLMGGRTVRPRWGRHPRLAIWGPLEARLQRADVLVLGGLNEGTWPPDPGADPWMSRPMRAAFGLPPPEWRVGLSAHDFAQAFSARTVVLTRATRVEGTPTVPSRWLLRLEAVAPNLSANEPGIRVIDNFDMLALATGLDEPGDICPIQPPRPCPPVAARPRRLSATQIETWMRDPYAVYARHVLGLRALEPIDADPGAADRGNFIHDALNRFLRAHRDALPEDALARLLAFGRQAFGAALERPGVAAFWWPRFEHVAEWVIEMERARRATIRPLVSEAKGTITLDLSGNPFELAAIADRIDRMADGKLAIIDYKTGALPSGRDVEAGFAPQLALEALIAEAGGFEDVTGAEVAALAFWRLAGGEPAGEEREDKHVRARIDEARDGIARLIAAFDQSDTPYLARPRPDRAPRYSDYIHLARVKEWSEAGGEP